MIGLLPFNSINPTNIGSPGRMSVEKCEILVREAPHESTLPQSHVHMAGPLCPLMFWVDRREELVLDFR